MKLGIPIALCATLALSSCNEEEEALLVEYEAQKEEIADLEFQIHRINKKITENHIKDPTEQIEELKTKLSAVEAQKEALLDEISDAKAETQKATEKLEKYKSDYPIAGN